MCEIGNQEEALARTFLSREGVPVFTAKRLDRTCILLSIYLKYFDCCLSRECQHDANGLTTKPSPPLAKSPSRPTTLWTQPGHLIPSTPPTHPPHSFGRVGSHTSFGTWLGNKIQDDPRALATSAKVHDGRQNGVGRTARQQALLPVRNARVRRLRTWILLPCWSHNSSQQKCKKKRKRLSLFHFSQRLKASH